MARVTRIALDLVLFSMRKAKPVVAKVWTMTKSAMGQTRAKNIVFSPTVAKVESSLDTLSESLIAKLRQQRNRLLPKEEQYLVKELEQVRNKMKDGGDGPWTTSRFLKPNLSIAWQYAKVEIAPPMTVGFLNGPQGKKLEDTVSKSFDGFINTVQGRINMIEAAEAKKIKDEEDAAKAAADKIKATAKAKEDAKKKEVEVKEAKDAKAAEKAKEKEKTEPPKAEKKPPAKTAKPKPKKK